MSEQAKQEVVELDDFMLAEFMCDRCPDGSKDDATLVEAFLAECKRDYRCPVHLSGDAERKGISQYHAWLGENGCL